jgi:DNA-directed RNA polymerase subunit H (RpoH/RPB5)
MTLIEEAKVHPLTCLTTLSEHEKHRFLDKQIVLCKDMRPHLLREYGVRPDKIPAIQEEARLLCGIED